MRINIELHGIHSWFELDKTKSKIIKDTIAKYDIGYLCSGFFVTNNIVNDVFRYTAVIEDRKVKRLMWNTSTDFPCSRYFDLKPFVTDKSIVVILESPHKDEFCYKQNSIQPIAPAQGVTGENIELTFKEHLKEAVKKGLLNDGEYPVIVTNPVPWQASLWFLNRKGISNAGNVKNDIWNSLWDVPIVANNFMKRLNSYRPCLIYNSCTGKSIKSEKVVSSKKPIHYALRSFISDEYEDIVINTYHPSSPHYNRTDLSIYPTNSVDVRHFQ